MDYQRLCDAISGVGGSLTHTGGTSGGSWLLQLGGYILEIASPQAGRFPDLEACYRSDDRSTELDPRGVARLLQKLLQVRATGPSIAAAAAAPRRERPEVRLKDRMAESTVALKALGQSPSRWLQLQAQYGTLGACRRMLAVDAANPDGYRAQLGLMSEHGALAQSIEAIATEAEFAPLFTDDELATARARLKVFAPVTS